jgi:predicted regulator of Ras-like GTPase activity (Roadblock/LC7/MglB family)
VNVCLRNLPAFQLSGPLPEIADDVVMELPYSVVEPQLASGRVAVDPKLFQQAIPEKFRDLFVGDSAGTPVLLPLHEVLQHLPVSALKMRHDQEQDEAVNYFETPFSLQAQEDQKRFARPAAAGAEQAGDAPAEKLNMRLGVAGNAEPPQAEAAKPNQKPAEAEPVAPASPADSAETGVAGAPPAKQTEQQAERRGRAEHPGSGESAMLPEPPQAAERPESAAAAIPATVEATSSAKEFVLRASCLPGVKACSIAFADGLTMAGNFPPGVGADGLCAMAPSLLQKIEKHMLESSLGELTAMTLHCSKSPLTFFMQGNVCLTVLHSDRQLEQVTQEQLAEMTRELAQIFAQPETTHVDH